MPNSEPPFYQWVGAELYMRVGHAITQWAHLLDGLFKIFRRLRGEPNFEISSAIFHTPPGDQVQIDMIDNAAKTVLSKSPLPDEWADLKKRAHHCLRLRNDLAHRVAGHHPTDSTKSVLRPGLFDVARTSGNPRGKQLTPKEINDRRVEISNLAKELDEFADKIPRLSALRPMTPQ